MRTLQLIGIGTGDPEQLTMEAVAALRRADVILALDKAGSGHRLLQVRHEICARYLPEGSYRFVVATDPERDRRAPDYRSAVADWSRRRAEVYRRLLRDEIPDGGSGAILVWGDPAFYDSTLRVLDVMVQSGDFPLSIEVVPGISSISVLAAKHRISLTRVSRPVLITTGRQLADAMKGGAAAGETTGGAETSGPETSGAETSGAETSEPETSEPETSEPADIVVMLNDSRTFPQLSQVEGAADWEIYWGANLGRPEERLVCGQLPDVIDRIIQERASLREAEGWVMDIFLLRRRSHNCGNRSTL